MTPLPWLIALAAAQQTGSAEPLKVHRTITLVDGRRFDAEVLSTEATGVEVSVAQGTLLVPFELLVDISPVPGEAPSAEPWRVLTAFPDDVEPTGDAVLRAIPNLAPSHVGDADDLSAATSARLAACGTDVHCLCHELREDPWRWVVVGERTSAGGLRVSSLVSTGKDLSPRQVEVEVADATHLWPALHEALGLHVPPLPVELAQGKPGKPGKRPPSRPPAGSPSSAKVQAWSAVPIPGAPALFATHDGANAALAFAVVLPSAAAWTGLSALATSGERDFLLLAGAGYLGLTVMTNQWVGDRSLRKLTAAAVPTEDGAVAMVGGTF